MSWPSALRRKETAGAPLLSLSLSLSLCLSLSLSVSHSLSLCVSLSPSHQGSDMTFDAKTFLTTCKDTHRAHTVQ
jgi:hypothetical protein